MTSDEHEVSEDEFASFTKEGALRHAAALLPTEVECISAGAVCYHAGLTIDEMATELHPLARQGGSERAWSWILEGYVDAKMVAEKRRELAQEAADNAEQRRQGEARTDLELDA